LRIQSASLAAIDDQWLDNKVRVTGTVRRLTIVELERELGRNLTTELEAEIKTRPILVARSVERVTAP
jgi:hypothetical protein